MGLKRLKGLVEISRTPEEQTLLFNRPTTNLLFTKPSTEQRLSNYSVAAVTLHSGPVKPQDFPNIM